MISTLSTDFTTAHYAELLRLAKQRYRFVVYDAIPWGERFVLWRHDCDISLNRSLRLARIEASHGIRSTFFLNPHSSLYNIFEGSQSLLIREIVRLGHEIGLHFDAAFHGVVDEESLGAVVRKEAALLEGVFGVRPVAFSFHNPLDSHLRCEAESYGGLVNCYSRRFRTEVPYCSDSNGYWRFRRLHDVLAQGADPCLQVLTHPGWWQETPMPPRQRIFRSIYGRAKAVMAENDATILAYGRENLSGPACALVFLRDVLPERYALLDFLWMSGEMAALFVELWRLHEGQINNLCKAVLRKEWQVPAREVNAFFDSPALAIDGWRLFVGVFGSSWQAASGVCGDAYQEWVSLRNQLVHGRGTAQKQRLEEGCVFLCEIIAALAAWGKVQSIGYDGLVHLGTIGLPTCETAEGGLNERLEELADEIPKFLAKKWGRFKAEMAEVGAGGTAA
ncbi:hypothetical protein LZ012_04580 [Dechloromonas sp. XY25]|uniref:Apea-like HEPN domain-containing protein n=1 Tax=Dechloromonas hankyongensis TaxID=2908002 RepID=A0ABS9JZC6_9RHOO|nr:hypothetical protein [Dechloromonas hankyongensis]MCG2576265.1 hypothetical protein [Dechloromonas hankyongensis]